MEVQRRDLALREVTAALASRASELKMVTAAKAREAADAAASEASLRHRLREQGQEIERGLRRVSELEESIALLEAEHTQVIQHRSGRLYLVPKACFHPTGLL